MTSAPAIETTLARLDLIVEQVDACLASVRRRERSAARFRRRLLASAA